MLFRKSDDDINGYYDTVINLSSYHKEITNWYYVIKLVSEWTSFTQSDEVAQCVTKFLKNDM